MDSHLQAKPGRRIIFYMASQHVYINASILLEPTILLAVSNKHLLGQWQFINAAIRSQKAVLLKHRFG